MSDYTKYFIKPDTNLYQLVHLSEDVVPLFNKTFSKYYFAEVGTIDVKLYKQNADGTRGKSIGTFADYGKHLIISEDGKIVPNTKHYMNIGGDYYSDINTVVDDNDIRSAFCMVSRSCGMVKVPVIKAIENCFKKNGIECDITIPVLLSSYSTDPAIKIKSRSQKISNVIPFDIELNRGDYLIVDWDYDSNNKKIYRVYGMSAYEFIKTDKFIILMD